MNRLDSYGGSDSGGVTQAKRRTEEKIEQLRDKAQAYTKYADDLSDLQKKCLSTDTAVRSRVSGLTASFKKANGINNNGIVNAINYMLTGLAIPRLQADGLEIPSTRQILQRIISSRE